MFDIKLNNYRLSNRITLALLLCLSLLFVFRVISQFLQLNYNISYLPGFEAWHSSTIPYYWLLASQIIIISAMIGVMVYIQKRSYRFIRIRAVILLIIGTIYFLFMLVRFVLSITILQDHAWFGATLPAFFHMVLASYLIVLGFYEFSNSGTGDEASDKI